jgi:hypothetical protein
MVKLMDEIEDHEKDNEDRQKAQDAQLGELRHLLLYDRLFV